MVQHGGSMRGLRRLRETLWPTDPLQRLDVERWLAGVHVRKPSAIALVVPKWYGVTSATANLFPDVLPIPPALTRAAAAKVARVLSDSGVPRVVFGAFASGMLPLVEALARTRIEVYALYFSSLMQQGERGSWLSLRLL